MQAKKNWVKLTMAIAGILFLIGISSAQAAPVVDTDTDGKATAIKHLMFEGTLYNVDFVIGTWPDIYNNPPIFDINEGDAFGFSTAINVVLQDNSISRVGPAGSDPDIGIYGIGFKEALANVFYQIGFFSDEEVWTNDVFNNPFVGSAGPDFDFIWADATVVPIPAAAWLLGGGLIGLLGLRRRFKN
jgi:hypothetical protein